MSDAWADAEAAAQEAQSGQWVKLGDGDEVVGAFVGDPYVRRVVWKDGKSEDFDAERHKGIRPKVRIILNFWDTEREEMRLWEMPASLFEDIAECRREHGAGCFYKVRRKGTGLDTKWRLLFSRKATAVDIDAIRGAELFDIEEELAKGDDEPAGLSAQDGPPADTYDDIPF